MFTVALFTIAKTWNQHKCPSMTDWIKKIWHIYTMEYYAIIKQDEFMSFAENDGFQLHSYRCKGHELILFYDGIVFHGVYVPHFPCPAYHQWAFGLVSGRCYCKQCCNEHSCACVLIVERFIILWIYTQ